MAEQAWITYSRKVQATRPRAKLRTTADTHTSVMNAGQRYAVGRRPASVGRFGAERPKTCGLCSTRCSQRIATGWKPVPPVGPASAGRGGRPTDGSPLTAPAPLCAGAPATSVHRRGRRRRLDEVDQHIDEAPRITAMRKVPRVRKDLEAALRIRSCAECACATGMSGSSAPQMIIVGISAANRAGRRRWRAAP